MFNDMNTRKKFLWFAFGAMALVCLGFTIFPNSLRLPSLTASRALVLNSSGDVTNATGTADATHYLDGTGAYSVPAGGGGSGNVSSNVAGGITAIGLSTNKSALYVESEMHAANVFSTAFVGDFALISDPTKEVVESATTSTELGFVHGVTSALQTQLNAKVDELNGVFTNATGRGLTLPSLTASRALVLNSSGNTTNASGTPDGTKFLRDDNTYAVPSGSTALSNLNDVNFSFPIADKDTIYWDQASSKWFHQFPFFSVTYNITTTNIYVGTNMEQSVTVKTNASFLLVFTGTPLNGEMVNLSVSNYGASVIYMTNTSPIYDPTVASNVTLFAIPALSIRDFKFINNTNFNLGVARWELIRSLQKESELSAAYPMVLITNANGSVITVSNTIATVATNYFIDIRTLGAIGDGTTDNTVSISNAIWQAGQSNFMVLVPPGNFLTDTQIVQCPGIMGFGTNSRLQLKTNVSGALLDCGGRGGVRIERLFLDGGLGLDSRTNFSAGQFTPATRIGIRHKAQGMGVVRDVLVANFDAYGLFITGTDTVTTRDARSLYENVIATNNCYGIYLESRVCEFSRILSCVTVMNTIGIRNESANTLVANCNFTDNYISAWQTAIGDSRGHNTWMNSIFNHSISAKAFICATNKTGMTFTGNMLGGNAQQMLFTNSVGTLVSGNWFENATVTYSTDCGTNIFCNNLGLLGPFTWVDFSANLIAYQNYGSTGLNGRNLGACVMKGTGLVYDDVFQSGNGIASYATNVIASANAAGYTNSTAAPGTGTGRNANVNISGTSGTFVFYNRSGCGGATVCGTALFTNTIIATGATLPVPVNSGIQVVSGVGVTIQVYAE